MSFHLAEYLKQISRLSASFMRSLWRLFKEFYRSPADRESGIEDMVLPLTEMVREGRKKSRKLAARFMSAQAKLFDSAAPVFAPDGNGYSEQAARTILTQNLRGEPLAAWFRVAAQANRHVNMAARELVVNSSNITARQSPDAGEVLLKENQGLEFFESQDPVQLSSLGKGFETDALPLGEADMPKTVKDEFGRRPFAWARVLTGAENCAFCIMLASRGPVYKSESSARFAGENNTGRKKFIRRVKDEYHDNCDCMVVPVYTSKNWPGKEQYEKALEFYRYFDRQGLRGSDLISAMNRKVDQMRKNGLTLDIAPPKSAEDGWVDSTWQWPPKNLPAKTLDVPIDYRLSESDIAHIWDGEPDNLKQGGHASGTGRDGKTEFPKEWTKTQAEAAINSAIATPDIFKLNISPSGEKNFEGYKLLDDVLVYIRISSDEQGKWALRAGYPRRGKNVYVNLGENNPVLRAPMHGKFLKVDASDGTFFRNHAK